MSDDESATVPASDRRPLWVVLEIDVGQDCPLVEVEAPIHEVDLQQMGGVCRAAVVTRSDDVEVRQVERQMGTDCIADAFYEHDVVPHVSGTTDDSLLITVHPSDHELIPDLIASIRDLGYQARIEQIVRIDEETLGTPPVLCDFGLLTDKQKEALTLAVDRGYYAQPREATLSDLAEELDVGKSAVSHRLQAAESKIIRNYLPRTDNL